MNKWGLIEQPPIIFKDLKHHENEVTTQMINTKGSRNNVVQLKISQNRNGETLTFGMNSQHAVLGHVKEVPVSRFLDLNKYIVKEKRQEKLIGLQLISRSCYPNTESRYVSKNFHSPDLTVIC